MKPDLAIKPLQGEFFTDLPPALQQTLSEAAKSRTYLDGTTIHRRGDLSPGLSIVRSGSVRLSNIGRDGREVVLITVNPGEAYGEFTLFADLPRQYDFIARGKTVIDLVSRTSFDALLTQLPDLGHHVIRHLARRLHQALDMLDDERRLPLPARLGKLLLRWPSQPTDDAVIIATQQDLADELAVSRVSLSGALKQLVTLNLIERGYGRLYLHDRKTLESWVSTNAQLSPASTIA